MSDFFAKKSTMRFLKCLLVVLMILTLAFTFYQSSKSKEESQETSEKVEQIIEPILPSDTPVGEYVQNNIRKIAHFVEFFALGAEVAIYVVLFYSKIKYAALSMLFAPIVALLDETVQIFSDRGPAISDVWIDVLGYFVANVLVYLIAFLVKKLQLMMRTSRASQASLEGEV